MVSLLKEIQDAAVDNNYDVATLLRKCKILSFRLGNDEFKEWIDFELNGYHYIEKLPKYRILEVGSYGDFCGPFGSSMTNVQIPPSCIPEKYRYHVTTSYVVVPISSCEELVVGAGGDLREQWPADAVACYGQGVLAHMNCIRAWKLVPRNAIVAILDTIKTRVLDFVLEIENEAPDAGEALPGVLPLPQEKVMQVFYTNIYGDAQNVSLGSNRVNQSRDIYVSQNDFDSLLRHLESQGVAAEDLYALDVAIKGDAKEQGKPVMGSQVQGWRRKMMDKAASGAWSVGLSAAGSVLGKALTSYFGIP